MIAALFVIISISQKGIPPIFFGDFVNIHQIFSQRNVNIHQMLHNFPIVLFYWLVLH